MLWMCDTHFLVSHISNMKYRFQFILYFFSIDMIKIQILLRERIFLAKTTVKKIFKGDL